MGFTVVDVPEITVNVDVSVPGEVEKSRITATWVLHKFDVYQKKNDDITSGLITDEQLVETDLVSAGPFYNPEGTEIPYSKELMQSLLKKTYFRTALIRSWWKAQLCLNEEAEKN